MKLKELAILICLVFPLDADAQRKVVDVPAPTVESIEFLRESPGLYGQRRVYRITLVVDFSSHPDSCSSDPTGSRWCSTMMGNSRRRD